MNTTEQVIETGPYAATWKSLETQAVPDWYVDGKFGIFIHWGVYAVPGFGNEWYPRNMYLPDKPEFQHHVATYGLQSQFGYKDFIPQFRAERFDAEEWAALFRASGAKFVVPVAEHHDGFAMYDTALSEWNAARMGPKRNILAELANAVRREGLTFGLSSHRAEHWWFFDGGRAFDSDVNDPRNDGLYGPAQSEKNEPDVAFLDDWFARTCELVDKYHPQLVWFDWWIEQPVFAPYLQRFAAYYYNRGAQWTANGETGQGGVAINYKNESFPANAAVLDIERGQLAGIRFPFWQTDTSVSINSWGYVANQNYKSVDVLITDLVDIVSKNGALLLNIGPRPDGTIPEPEIQMLREIGAWLAVNGEAIYGTRPWHIFGEGPTEIVTGSFSDDKRQPFTGQDIRFTTKGDVLYAVALSWPGETLTIGALKTGSEYVTGEIGEVTLLGHDGALETTRNEQGLTIRLPDTKPCDHAFTFKITCQEIQAI